MFGYNATVDKQRRQSPATRTNHERNILNATKRKKIQATAQEQVRNHSLVAWMVRKHLDYVSKFHFSFRVAKSTDDSAGTSVDTIVNRIFRWHGAPQNLDYGRRFGRDELFRLFELEKVVSGDAGLIKLSNILKLQAVESDLIAKGTVPPGGEITMPKGVTSEGLIMGDNDAWVEQFAICNRGPAGKTIVFDHMEPAENVIFDGYWTRLSSQNRGVSPLSTAINTVQDIYEGLEYNQVKSKMHALFGVAVFRQPEASGELGGGAGATKETAGTGDSASDANLDLNLGEVGFLDFDVADKIQLLESATPSAEFVNGSYLFIQIAMLALDFPITTFDSRRSSFSGRIADLNEYEVSADAKRTKNRYVRQNYSDWVLDTIWNDSATPWPLRKLATANGMSLRDVQEAAEWIPSGSPWLDKYKQILGDQLAIEIGEDNIIDATRRRGGNFYGNIDKQKQAMEYAREQGVAIMVGTSRQQTVDEAIQRAVAAGIQNERESESEDDE